MIPSEVGGVSAQRGARCTTDFAWLVQRAGFVSIRVLPLGFSGELCPNNSDWVVGQAYPLPTRFRMVMDTTPSKKSLIEGLKSFAEEVDSVPTIRGMRDEGPYSPHYYKEEFGSWHDALRAADIQPTHGVTPDASREALLEELQKVNEVTERPPRRKDVEEHGQYPYSLYDEEFGSFVLALEEAGIDPDEKQYRFSSVDTPEEKKGSANMEKLRNNGPTPSTELPQGRSTKDRQLGVWKFNIDSGAIKPADSIYYIDGEHAPELVIRRFFQQNPHVLKSRDSHGIKMEIKNHQPSWKEIGREVVDELVEDGLVPAAEFENLVVIRVYDEEVLRYCFDSSVSSLVNIGELSITEGANTDHRPVWGFSRENKAIWQALSQNDGLLFSTRSGVFTHYVPIAKTFENSDVMTELWVDYEDGVRSGGIEKPWPYLALGEDVRDITIREQKFAEEIDISLSEEPIQAFDEEAMKPLLNNYGGFESYLRDRDRSNDYRPSGVNLDGDPSFEDVVDLLFQVTEDDLPAYEDDSELEEIERETRKAAFREGIYEIYPGCAICGKLLESPEGSLDLEAAHILPKAQDGPDLLQNGLGLCSQHHWAFDHGWFKISVDYEIHVRDYPQLEGYNELKQYHGEYLQVPGEENLQPHSYYIRQRNQIHER